MVSTRTQFNPEAFATYLEERVMPELARAAVDRGEAGQREALFQNLGESPSAHAQALLAAAERIAPPDDLSVANEIYPVIIGAISLRANTPEMTARYPYDLQLRYLSAGDWVCEHFRSIIFWCK